MSLIPRAGHPTDIWDHRNASLREWLLKEHVMGASSGGMDGMSNPNVTGFCEFCRAMKLRQPRAITRLAAVLVLSCARS